MMGFTHFAQPLWLLAGAVMVLVALLLFALYDTVRRRRMRAFSLARDTDASRFAVSRVLLWLKRTVFCLAAFSVCAALARPLGSMQLQESEQRGLDILFAIDTSRSMLTPDVKPDRLTRAKLAVEDLLDHLEGDGVGLVAFAGEAFLQAPVTTDYDAFRETLDSLDTHTIALGGTDIAAAIRMSESTLAARGDTQKVLVLITDGEDLAGDALLAAQAAAKQGLIIFTVGVGTAAGELIPIPDPSGGTQFVKDPGGNFVKSRLDADMLTQIAAATGGIYTPLGPQGQGVVALYDAKLKGFAQHEHSDHQVAVYAELFQWPLICAIGLLILEWLLGTSVRRRAPVATKAAPAVSAVMLLLLAVAMAPTARATPLSAQEEYNRGQYAQAQRDYAQSLKADPGQSHLQFNLGTAAYRAGDFASAATAFTDALKTQEIPLQQSAYYNLGNALFRQGEKGVAKDPQSTIHTWQQALGAYDTALQIKPRDLDAKFNRDVVQRRLDELQRQQQQKQKQNEKQQNQDKQDQGDKQKQQGQQSNQQSQPNHPGQPGQPDQQGQEGQQGQKGQQGQNQNPQGQQNPQNAQNQPAQRSPQGQPQQNSPDPNGQPDPSGQPKPQPAGPTQADPRQASDAHAQQGNAAAAQDIGKPGQMSRLEAEQLLDAAKGEERQLIMGGPNGKPPNRAATPLKDW